jgi:hypothetical protein
MKIDEITRAAIRQLDNAGEDANRSAPANCKGKGGKCPAVTTNKSGYCNDCLADLSEALKRDNAADALRSSSIMSDADNEDDAA